MGLGLGGLLAAACALAVCTGATAQQAPRFVPFAKGFSTPVFVTATPAEPNRLYVVEQDGRVRVLVGGKLRREVFLDVRGRIVSGGEQGLLSLVFHPSYAQNRRLYVNFTDPKGDTRVVEYRSDGTRVRPGTARQILFVDQPYSNHNGGQLQFGPDGRLYVGMGDGGSGGDPENRAQDPDSLLGKLLRIDVDRAAARPEIVGYGLRNPWRFSFDRAKGDLWIGDVGQGDWEEIDHLPRSSPGLENFGWAAYEGRVRFDERKTTRGRLVFPVAVYSHALGCSVTGGYVYRGKAVPAARGRYYYGDYCSGVLWSLRLAGGKASVRQEAQRIPQLSSFGEDAAGELYAASHDGTIYRLTR